MRKFRKKSCTCEQPGGHPRQDVGMEAYHAAHKHLDWAHVVFCEGHLALSSRVVDQPQGQAQLILTRSLRIKGALWYTVLAGTIGFK